MREQVVELPEKGKAVFVGDTHGDFYTTKFIVKNFLDRKGFTLVFLGDYVDRGPYSKENIDFLLSLKAKKDNLILLAGNHEMHPVIECAPSDFWDTLDEKEFNYYKEKFLEFPLCVVGRYIIGLHGVVPEVEKIEDIETITPEDENWIKIIWGDFRDKEGEKLGNFLGRPKFGKEYFLRVMKNIEKNVLIRSHDPLAPERMFDNRCLTIFTSSAYGRERKIAIVDLEKEIKTIDDIEIISFDQKDIENES